MEVIERGPLKTEAVAEENQLDAGKLCGGKKHKRYSSDPAESQEQHKTLRSKFMWKSKKHQKSVEAILVTESVMNNSISDLPNNGTARTLKDENKENKNAIHGALTINPSSVMPCDNKVSTSKIINSAYCLGNTDGQNSVEQNDPGICAGGTACIDENLQDYIHEDPVPLDSKPVRQLTKMNSNENVERWLKYYQGTSP